MTSFTLANVISSIGDIFTGAVGWMGDIGGAIAADPFLLAGVCVGFVGLGVGLWKRLFRA